MQADAWIKRMVTVWPSLPFAALGFILAWNMLAFTGAVWVSSPDVDSIYRKQQYILSNSAFGLTLLAFALFSKRFAPFLEKSRSAVLGGAVSLVGSAAIILVGPYFFSVELASVVGPIGVQILYYTGCVLAGAGNALVVEKCAELYGSVLPRNTIVHAAQATITAIALYFIATGFPDWRYSGSGPLVIGVGAFLTLPLLGGVLASLAKHSPEARFQAHGHSEQPDIPRPFWRMVIVLALLSFASAMVAGYADATVPLADSSRYASLGILLQIPVSLLFVAFAAAYHPERHNFGRIFTAILVILAFAIALAATTGRYIPAFYQILPFASHVFAFTVRCVLFFLIFQRQASSPVIFGYGYGLYTLADSVGWFVGSILFPELPITVTIGVSVALAFLSLASAFLLFSSKDFDDLFESQEQGRETLSSLMERRLDSGVTTDTHRGKFRVAIDIVADEYGLSRREKDVLRHLAMGHDATRIAEELGVSWNTVRTHTRNLYGKLDVHSKQELAALVDSYRS
ncbi:MAG: helix-turn-helix transcriptional regulator [Eggerthellaceae bacterium]|nr:helix-turn-helix transcriptional regulator [Eggerthellaceae bacterium]